LAVLAADASEVQGDVVAFQTMLQVQIMKQNNDDFKNDTAYSLDNGTSP
jgi:hypothetical protein